MRKGLIALAVTVTAFTGVAGVAAADDPNPYVNGQRGANYEWASCTSHETIGYLGQYGAQGFFIDGCTSPRVYCPWGRVCVVNTANNIDTRPHYGHWMTQNARVRVFNSSGQLRWQHDSSCGNTNMCSNYDYYAYIYGGESATSQCNGVRDRSNYMSTMSRNYCEVKVTYL
jgi:hypothetical protein